MLVIFDMDGTLIDSQHSIVSAAKEALYTNGFDQPDDKYIKDGIGLSLPEAISRLLPSKADKSVVNDVIQSYRNAFMRMAINPEISDPMFTGAKECLKTLYDKHHTLGVATGKSLNGLSLNLKSHEIADYFSTLQTADTCPSKPHPCMVEKAMAETGASKNETIMVGDTIYDIMAGNNAGVKSIGVSWGYHSSDDLRNSGAYQIIDDFSQLIDLLEKISE
jgi:phosphoglycolate phosphatase